MEGNQTKKRGKLWGWLTGTAVEEEFEYDDVPETRPTHEVKFTSHQAVKQYKVSLRKNAANFQDAVQAADGLKSGEQQILNLYNCQPETRERIKDFLQGVAYNAEGEMVELGEHVWMIAPASADVSQADPARGRKETRFN